ncbi:MAG TPA: UvrD-helicase domain-containing protein [Myxococcaceae bacterium]|nr:UvrD-helicase domain-containing protein [Myxococcaceae bacterium]
MEPSGLNARQREAVMSLHGPLLVLAGAGSGKTRVITHRIVQLLSEKAPAQSFLAVTFTNKAAAEMKERVMHMAGRRAGPVLISTFHAFGAEVLKADLPRLGYPRKFAIADMGDQLALVKRAMRDRRVDDRAFDARKVLTAISRAKNARAVPQPKLEGMGDDYDLVTAEVFPLYQLGLRAQGAVDFDDLLVLPAQLLREHPDVREKYLRRFRYLLVDEFQDTNAAQLDLLELLAGESMNVCAVGDDDQCIYSWRGAEVRNILHFERSFPGAKEVRLEQNYRSSQVILEAANAVIAHNPDRKAKRMWTDRAGGERIRVVVAPSEEDEARFVAGEIARQIDLQGVSPDDIAVLYRTNGQSHPVEEALREKKISYEVVGGSEFFDRREVKDVIAWFKVIANPKDETSLLRIVNVPPRGIGDVTMERLVHHARADGSTLQEAMSRAQQFEDLPRGAAEAVGMFCELVARYRKLFSSGNLAEVTRGLLEEIGFRNGVRATASSATAADRKIRSIDQLLQSLESYEKREGAKAGLLTYLNRLSLDTREEEDGPSARRVTLMTLHAAKGLEFRVVFLIGLEEDTLPHSGMQGEAQNLEEERRLCYVGITRARERLFLTRASARMKRGKEVPRTPSRFLADIPQALLEQVDLAAPPPGPPTERELRFFATLKERLRKEGGTLASGAPGVPPGGRARAAGDT